MDEVDAGEDGTFSALDTKLTTLLQGAVGGTPIVDINTTDNEYYSNLDLQIVLAYAYNRSEEINIDLNGIISDLGEDNKAIAFFAKALIPDSSASAGVNIEASLTLTLDVGVEYNKANKSISSYIKDSTGAKVTFLAEAIFGFGASIGPFPGTVDAGLRVGSSSEPVTLTVGLPGNGAKYYLFGGGNESKSITDVLNDVNVSFSGAITADIIAEIPDIGAKLEVNVTVDDILLALRGNSSAFKVEWNTTGPTAPKIPTLLEILLSDPQGLIDAIDDIFERAEAASLGRKGIITTFPAPFIGKALGDSLGAGTDDNIIANVRRKVVGTLQERLDGYEEPPTTLAKALANEMAYILEDAGILRLDKGGVDVECFSEFDNATKTHPIADCTGEGVASLQWTLNIGQILVIELDLDFSLGGDFPLELELSGTKNAPTLTIEWFFTLGFGYDESVGFFLSTFEEDESELGVTALFSMKGMELSAQLFFLRAELENLNLNVGAGVLIDIVKADNTTGPAYGRITRGDLRKINRPADLFEITAVAGAAVDFDMVTSVVLPTALEDIERYIPKLEAKIFSQARKEIDILGGKRRKLLGDKDRRMLARTHANNPHPSAGIFRWLAADREATEVCSDPTGETYAFRESGTCYKCPVAKNETFCAMIFDVQLDVKSITDAVLPIVKMFVNPGPDDGYLDKIIKPFVPLGLPIPGLSEITGSKASVLTFAKIYDKSSGAETVEKVLKVYEALKKFIEGLGDGKILLATKCNFFKFPGSCVGGLFDDERRYLSEDGSMVSRRLALDISNCGENCNQGNCGGTGGTKKAIAKRKASIMKCKASGVEGLSFPFIEEPTTCLNLLSGGDIVSSLFVSNDLFRSNFCI
jgi:hypothetical protein